MKDIRIKKWENFLNEEVSWSKILFGKTIKELFGDIYSEINKLKEILIELLKEESYGACDIQTWVDTHGVVFKPMATSDELEKRVDFFIKRNEKVKKYCV